MWVYLPAGLVEEAGVVFPCRQLPSLSFITISVGYFCWPSGLCGVGTFFFCSGANISPHSRLHTQVFFFFLIKNVPSLQRKRKLDGVPVNINILMNKPWTRCNGKELIPNIIEGTEEWRKGIWSFSPCVWLQTTSSSDSSQSAFSCEWLFAEWRQTTVFRAVILHLSD